MPSLPKTNFHNLLRLSLDIVVGSIACLLCNCELVFNLQGLQTQKAGGGRGQRGLGGHSASPQGAQVWRACRAGPCVHATQLPRSSPASTEPCKRGNSEEKQTASCSPVTAGAGQGAASSGLSFYGLVLLAPGSPRRRRSSSGDRHRGSFTCASGPPVLTRGFSRPSLGPWGQSQVTVG